MITLIIAGNPPSQSQGAIMAKQPKQSAINTRSFLESDVVIQDSNLLTTTIAISECSGNQHKNVMELVRTHLGSLGRFGEVAFQTLLNPQGSPTEYALLNQEQTTFLFTCMKNTDIIVEFKVQLVLTFSAMAKQLTQPVSTLPSTYKEALQHLLVKVEENEKLELSLKQAQPAITFHQQVAATGSTLSIEQFAKSHGKGRNKTKQALRDHGYLNSNDLPYQRFMEQGYFEVAQVPVNGVTRAIIRITTKGNLYLSANLIHLMK